MDALDLVLSQNGISTPSKRTRKTIIKVSEKISRSVQKDLKKTHRQNKFKNLKMDSPVTFKGLVEGVSA